MQPRRLETAFGSAPTRCLHSANLSITNQLASPSRNPRPNGRNISPHLKTTETPASSDIPTARWIATILAKRVGANPDAVQSGDATIAIWYDMAIALQSIIGKQGVSALYNRSVALSTRAYPWLASSRAGDDHSIDLDALRSVIALQSNEVAAAGSRELLQTFYGVLVSLIGASLCEQLLASVRDDIASSGSRDRKNI